jgi:hypothetical protein
VLRLLDNATSMAVGLVAFKAEQCHSSIHRYLNDGIENFTRSVVEVFGVVLSRFY